MINVSSTQPHVRYVINTTLVRLQAASRLNNYKSKSRKFDKNEKCIQQYLYSHFESERHNGFLEDVSITLTDKTDGSDPTKRETFWMHILETLVPHGLSVENGIQISAAMSG